MSTEDDTTTPPPERTKGPGVDTRVASGILEGVEEQRKEDKLDKLIDLVEGLSDDRAMVFAKQEAKAKRAEACTKIAVNLVQPAAMKYYAGIVAMVVAGYMGLSLSGYGVTVGAGDCPTPEVQALTVPDDAP